MRHGALVLVVVGVEDQRFERGVLVALRGGDVFDDLLHHLVDVDAELRGDAGRFVGRDADHVLDLFPHPLGLGARQVDLVDDGEDLEPRVHREVSIGERLRLDALRGVHHEHGALARGQRARDLVVEVHVAGRVDQVEDVVPPVFRVVQQRDGVGLDGDAALALQVHVVEDLVFHLAQRHGVRQLQDAVGQRALAVVDMGDDAEIADVFAWDFQSRFTSAGLFREAGRELSIFWRRAARRLAARQNGAAFCA